MRGLRIGWMQSSVFRMAKIATNHQKLTPPKRGFCCTVETNAAVPIN